MTGLLFDRPLFVKTRRFIQEIGCLDDIFDFLEEGPEDKRDLAHETMSKRCQDAAVGRLPLSALRDNFKRFLKKNGLLAEVEDVPFLAQRTTDRSIGGM